MTDTKCIPETICGILEELEGERVVVVLKTGDKELVKVLAVTGNIVVTAADKRIKFINCDCICSVIADCCDVLADKFRLQCDNG